MTVAALQALVLQRHLRHTDRPGSRRILRDLARVLDGPWDMARGADLALPLAAAPPRPLHRAAPRGGGARRETRGGIRARLGPRRRARGVASSRRGAARPAIVVLRAMLERSRSSCAPSSLGPRRSHAGSCVSFTRGGNACRWNRNLNLRRGVRVLPRGTRRRGHASDAHGSVLGEPGTPPGCTVRRRAVRSSRGAPGHHDRRRRQRADRLRTFALRLAAARQQHDSGSRSGPGTVFARERHATQRPGCVATHSRRSWSKVRATRASAP
jgi:hypothetical protein